MKNIKDLEIVKPEHKKDIQEWLWTLCLSISHLSREYDLNTPSMGIHSDLEYPVTPDCDWSFRIYHSKGYCVDIKREYDSESNEFEYAITESWDGFTEIGEGKWLKILNDLNEDLKTQVYFKHFPEELIQ